MTNDAVCQDADYFPHGKVTGESPCIVQTYQFMHLYGAVVSKRGHRSKVVVIPGIIPKASCPLFYRFKVDGTFRACHMRYVCRLNRRRLEE